MAAVFHGEGFHGGGFHGGDFGREALVTGAFEATCGGSGILDSGIS